MVKEYARSITIGISTSALFEMEDAKRLRDKYGEDFYTQYMCEKEDEPLQPGYFFDVLQTMNGINKTLGHTVFDFVLLSTNTSWTGIRAVKSCMHYDIPFSGALFGNGPLNPEYIEAHGVNWFITTNNQDAENAQNMGIASCVVDPLARPVDASKEVERILNGRIRKSLKAKVETPDEITKQTLTETFNKKLHLVWDLDRVLFSGESDDVFGKKGIDGYSKHESHNSHVPIEQGPFAPIAEVMGRLSSHFDRANSPVVCSALTARGSVSTLRALHSLRDSGINFNGELHFTGGGYYEDGEFKPKGIQKDRILRIMDKDPQMTTLFLDDSERTINDTKGIVTSGLVPREAGGFAIGEKRKNAPKGPK